MPGGSSIKQYTQFGTPLEAGRQGSTHPMKAPQDDAGTWSSGSRRWEKVRQLKITGKMYQEGKAAQRKSADTGKGCSCTFCRVLIGACRRGPGQCTGEGHHGAKVETGPGLSTAGGTARCRQSGLEDLTVPATSGRGLSGPQLCNGESLALQ